MFLQTKQAFRVALQSRVRLYQKRDSGTGVFL